MIEGSDIEKLASLSRMKLSDEERESFSKEIDSILVYISQIREAGAGSIGTESPLRSPMRDDLNPHESGIFTSTLLEQSPDKEGNHFKVKKIL